MPQKPLKQLIEQARERYNTTKNVYCPFLKEVVYFNNVGFFHATHDGRGRIRGEKDTRNRLELLRSVNTAINRSGSFNRKPILTPKNDPDNKTNKDVRFYELSYRVNPRKVIVVVLRKLGNGRLHYYSVRLKRQKQNRPRRRSA